VHPRVLAAAAGSVLALAGAASGQTTYVWTSGVSGAWPDTTKWTPSGFPGAADNAAINASGSYLVSVPASTTQSVNNLSVGGAGVTLLVVDNSNLVLNGPTHTNNGLIQINQTNAAGNLTRITVANGSASLGGSGVLTLAGTGNGDNNSSYLTYGAAGNVLTNGASHTINGQGRVFVNLSNSGTVDANVPGGVLHLIEQPKSNSGTMRASGGGALVVECGALTQTGTGVLSAQTGSGVVLVNTTVSGGSLSSAGTGAIVNNNSQSSGLDGVTLTSGSLLQINDNSRLDVGPGGLVNNGLMTIQNIGGAGNLTQLRSVAPAATISGTGTVTLQATSNFTDSAYLSYSSTSNQFVLGSGQVLNGAGRVYTGLTNGGVIDANRNGQVLQLLDQGKTNAGTMRATGGGQLWISNIGVTQTGAGQLRADNGTVVLQNATISGGPMASVNGGIIVNTNSVTSVLNATTLTQGLLQINDNSNLMVQASLVNNGLVTIQNIGGAGNLTRLTAGTAAVSLTGAGTVRLQATGDFNDSAYLTYSSAANVLTNGAGHTIAGNGRIYTNLVNNGVVAADETTSGRHVLQLLEQPKTNNNLIRATNGGQVWLSSVGLTQSPTATLRADTGSTVVTNNASISGGLLTSSGTGLLVCNNSQTTSLDSVTLTSGSFLQVNDNSNLIATTGLVNNGLITIQNIGGAGNLTRLTAGTAAVPLTGSGTVRLQATGDFNDSAYLTYSAAANVLTNGAGHTIAGNGRIYTNLVNNGAMVADGATSGRHVLQLLEQPKTNNNLIRATSGGQVWLSNVGISQGPSGQIVADSGSVTVLQSAGVSGGTMSSSGTGAIINNNSQSSTLDGVTLATGSLLQINDNSVLSLGPGGVVNNGTITVQNVGGAGNLTRILAPAAGAITGTGTLRLQATGVANDSAYVQGQGDGAHPLTIGPGQQVTGTGRFYGNIVSQGTITPDQPFGTPGPIGVIEAQSGSLTMAPTSVLNLQIASPSSFDRITGNDAVTVDGVLNVSFTAGYVPHGSDYFDVVTGSSVSGHFSSVNIPPFGLPGPAHVVYLPSAVRIVMCYANCDGSSTAPVLTVNDFVCFQGAFAAGDSYANCDGSTTAPVLNVNDFICFQSRFAPGCN
jgi:hypothetical protein